MNSKRNRDYVVSRIIAGYIPIVVNDVPLLVHNINKHQKIQIAQLYQKSLREAELRGMLTEDEYLDLLIEHGLWSTAYQDRLSELEHLLEDLKLELFTNYLVPSKVEVARQNIHKTEEIIGELYYKRHMFDYATCEGYAALARTKAKIEYGLRDIEGNPVSLSDFQFDVVLHEYESQLLDMFGYRDIARNDPFRSLWSVGKESVFEGALQDWSEEQIWICLWAKMYDSVYESMECPEDRIIEDDYALDGWFIKQRRTRQNEIKKKQAEELLPKNKNAKEAQDLFIVAKSQEDVRAIMSLNDIGGKIEQKQRLGSIPQDSSIQEQDMPIVRQKLEMEFTKLLSERMKK